MKIITLIVSIGLASLWPAHAGAAGEGDFVLVKQDNIVSLYERWIKNAAGDKTREVKAVFEVHCTVEAATRLLMDTQRGKEWNAHAKTFSVLSLGRADQWVTYIRYGIPWPIGDQDCCLLYTVQSRPADGSQAVVHFESTQHERFPENDKITRITGTSGQWLLDKTGTGTRITYLVSTNRSSKVPRWISDPLVRNNLFETMTSFKKILEQP